MPISRETFDINAYQPAVLIIGGGLAASATGLGLARYGIRSLIIDRGDDSGDIVGESIPSSTQPLLHRLGIFGEMEKDGHIPYHTNRSAWGSESLEDYDFIRTPYGHGWILDRRRFESMLVHQAVEAGARRLTQTRVTLWERSPVDGWKFSLRTPETDHDITARFVVDATGRASWFARQMGSKRSHDDRMLGVVSFFRTDARSDPERIVLIEAVESGWWYSAVVPDGRLATIYFSDADLIDYRQVRTLEGWLSLVNLTEHTARRINDHGYFPDSPPYTVSAGSSQIEPLSGEGWLAVGDAASAFDPLSSYGITSALAGGLQAAEAIKKALEGTSKEVATYAAQISEIYAGYRKTQTAYYRMERRWPTSPFWSRRSMSGPLK